MRTFRNLILAMGLALALFVGPVGCATQSIQSIAAEEGVEVTPELRYYGALADYGALKQDILTYAALPSTSIGEIRNILFVINGGTDDTGCEVGSSEPRCLDGSDGAVRAFEAIRVIGGASPDRFEAISVALATAAAQIRASGAGGE